MLKFSKILTTVLSPLLMPTYAIIWLLVATYLQLLPVQYKLYALGLVVLTTLVMPGLLFVIYRRLRHWDNRQLLQRQNRHIIYALAMLSFCLCSHLLGQMGAPRFMRTVPVTSLVILLLAALINFRWKVSTHLFAIGAICGGYAAYSLLFAFQPIPGLVLITLLSGLLATAQRILRQHTNLQLLVSYLLGLLIAFVITLI